MIASLIVGIAYMAKTGDVQTAWTIASYIVTATGGKYIPMCPSDSILSNTGEYSAGSYIGNFEMESDGLRSSVTNNIR